MDFISERELLATVPKSRDVDTRVSLVVVAGSGVLEVQDVVRSTGHVGRGWYINSDSAGRACAREVAAMLLQFAEEG